MTFILIKIIQAVLKKFQLKVHVCKKKIEKQFEKNWNFKATQFFCYWNLDKRFQVSLTKHLLILHFLSCY